MTSTAQRITVRHQEENFGPYLLQDVNQLLVSGRIDRHDLAWVEGTLDWQPLAAIPGVIAVPPMPASDEELEHQDSSSRRLMPAFLMAFFVGVFGVHRFYVGRTSSAIAMLLLTLSVVGVFITAIWATIDWIMILCGAFEDDEQKLLTRWT